MRLHEAVKRLESADSTFELRVPCLELERGKSYIVSGRSGCGKTTLLDALGMLSQWTRCAEHLFMPTHGKVCDLLRMKAGIRADVRRREIGYILQQGGLLPFLTAWENIILSLRLSGKQEQQATARELVERLGVAEQMELRPDALSIGQRQRVSIARALSIRPTLVLADEPTGALDPIAAASVRDLLMEVAGEQGSAVVVVTHDVELFAAHADVCLGYTLERHGSTTVSTLGVQQGKEVKS